MVTGVVVAVLATLKKVGDGVVRHVDGRVREGLNDKLLVPRHERAKAKGARACPLLKPVKSLHKGLASGRGVGLKSGRVTDVVLHLLAPFLFTILKEPLIEVCHNTLVTRAADNLALRLEVDNGLVILTHLGLDNILGLSNLHSLNAILLTSDHDTLIEATLVCLRLSLLELLLIILRLDLQFLNHDLCCTVAKSRNVDHRHNIKGRNHLLGNSVLSTKLLIGLPVTKSSVVISTVRRHRGHNTSSLVHGDRQEGKGVHAFVFCLGGLDRNSDKLLARNHAQKLELALLLSRHESILV
mmetsp:Transcript_1402/g.3373  ORF Transcript_1402/g.3373 Transcript_1402/m.3373 type:complete len:298 (+) Transcript_1402:1452-2345(+)